MASPPTALGYFPEVESLHGFIDVIPDAALIADVEGRVVYANPPFERLSGYDGKTLQGLTVEDLMPPRYRERHKDHRLAYHANPRSRPMGTLSDLYLLRQDDAEVPIDISLTPIRTETGLLVLAIIHDISRRRKAETALVSRARKLAALFQLSQRVVVDSDLERLMNETVALISQALEISHVKVLECLPGNPNRLILQTAVGWPEELAGRLTINAEEDFLVKEALATCDPILVENARTDLRFQTSPWLEGVTSGVCVPIRCGHGRPDIQGKSVGVLCAYSRERREFKSDDLDFLQSAANTLALACQRKESENERQRLQNELLRVSRISAVGELGATVAHELNQPLTAVQNYLEACRRYIGKCDCPKAVTPLTMIDKAEAETERAHLILRRLREFIEKGRLNRREEQLNAVIDEAARLTLAGAWEKNIQPHFNLASELPLAFIDRIQIQQVVFNLVSNAVEVLQASERREITLRTGRGEGGFLEVQIEDTGPGLDPGRLDQFFKTYHSTKQGGMGLGLSICHSIIAAHGGRLWVTETLGGGATLHFTVPVARGNKDEHETNGVRCR